MTKIISVEHEADQQYIDMVWRIFFQQKLRGITIETHFPWIKTSNSDVWYVIIRDRSKIIGGLAVREIRFSFSSDCDMVLGIVGLVCIEPEFRGLGLTRELLSLLIEESKARGYDALTLWTNKHAVYSPHDFILSDHASFGFVNMQNYLRTEQNKIKPERFSLQNHLGLPPFALRGFVYSTCKANIRVVEDTQGPIFVDWSGDIIHALSLIEKVLPTFFRFNTFVNDELKFQLIQHGATLQLSDSNLQMWYVINKKYKLEQLVNNAHFSLLDRI